MRILLRNTLLGTGATLHKPGPIKRHMPLCPRRPLQKTRSCSARLSKGITTPPMARPTNPRATTNHVYLTACCFKGASHSCYLTCTYRLLVCLLVVLLTGHLKLAETASDRQCMVPILKQSGIKCALQLYDTVFQRRILRCCSLPPFRPATREMLQRGNR